MRRSVDYLYFHWKYRSSTDLPISDDLLYYSKFTLAGRHSICSSSGFLLSSTWKRSYNAPGGTWGAKCCYLFFWCANLCLGMVYTVFDIETQSQKNSCTCWNLLSVGLRSVLFKIGTRCWKLFLDLEYNCLLLEDKNIDTHIIIMVFHLSIKLCNHKFQF